MTASSLVQPTLTSEQTEAYTAAMSAVAAYVDTVNQASAAPDQDWSSELAKVAADPLLSEIKNQLKQNADDGTRITGQTVLDYSVPMAGPVEVRVVPGDQSVDRSSVTLAVCIDASDQKFVSSSGQSSNAFGDYSRVPVTVKVAEFPGQAWLVGFYQIDSSKTC